LLAPDAYSTVKTSLENLYAKFQGFEKSIDVQAAVAEIQDTLSNVAKAAPEVSENGPRTNHKGYLLTDSPRTMNLSTGSS